MSSTTQPGQDAANVPLDEQGLPAVPHSSQTGQIPGDRRASALAELGEFFARRRDRRGIFLPLVSIDRSE